MSITGRRLVGTPSFGYASSDGTRIIALPQSNSPVCVAQDFAAQAKLLAPLNARYPFSAASAPSPRTDGGVRDASDRSSPPRNPSPWVDCWAREKTGRPFTQLRIGTV